MCTDGLIDSCHLFYGRLWQDPHYRTMRIMGLANFDKFILLWLSLSLSLWFCLSFSPLTFIYVFYSRRVSLPFINYHPSLLNTSLTHLPSLALTWGWGGWLVLRRCEATMGPHAPLSLTPTPTTRHTGEQLLTCAGATRVYFTPISPTLPWETDM